MSNNQNQSSNQESQNQQNQESQSAEKSSASEGQKSSAPEHPPVTPMNQRSNSANFGEDTGKDIVDL